MGPTNTALHQLFVADQELRAAEAALDAATRGLRVQRLRVQGLTEQARTAHDASQHARASAENLNLDLQARSETIDKLREQQQNAQGAKEYQAFLTEINAQKEQRTEVEERALAAMQIAEDKQAELESVDTQRAAEQEKLAELESGISDRVAHLEAEVKAKQPARDEAAEAVPSGPRDQFERLAERYDGEAMAPLEMPDGRKMEFFCGSCNRELMVDAYNKLAVGDAPVTCPSCDRLLFVPPSLTPEQAVPKKAKKRASPRKKTAPKKPTTLKPMITTASAESLREAEVAGVGTVHCEVTVDGKAAGSFDALSVEDLEQRVRAKMQAADVEAKLIITSRSPTQPLAEPADQPPANPRAQAPADTATIAADAPQAQMDTPADDADDIQAQNATPQASIDDAANR